MQIPVEVGDAVAELEIVVLLESNAEGVADGEGDGAMRKICTL